jgi:hypothetical protein
MHELENLQYFNDFCGLRRVPRRIIRREELKSFRDSGQMADLSHHRTPKMAVSAAALGRKQSVICTTSLSVL